MQFLSVVETGPPMSGPPSPEMMAKMGVLVEELMKAGSLVMTGPLAPAKQSVSVRHTQGRFDMADCPDALGGAAAGGYAILEAPDMDGAVALSKRFMAVAGDGECQLRAIPVPPRG